MLDYQRVYVCKPINIINSPCLITILAGWDPAKYHVFAIDVHLTVSIFALSVKGAVDEAVELSQILEARPRVIPQLNMATYSKYLRITVLSYIMFFFRFLTGETQKSEVYRSIIHVYIYIPYTRILWIVLLDIYDISPYISHFIPTTSP